MCTAITLKTNYSYFGRNLDLEYSYNETVTITPRNFPFHFRNSISKDTHYAIIGMAYVCDNYPLYYDGTNEKGLSAAALNFPQNAVYNDIIPDKDNIAPFEFIPWILSNCENVNQAKELLANSNVVNQDFNENLPASPLHWIISDRDSSITVEQTNKGLIIYDNPFGVLTNNPPFDYHLQNIQSYMQLSSMQPTNNLLSQTDIIPFSRGMGAMGLPGDWSSSSRFVRAVFTKNNSCCTDKEDENIMQFFHILSSVHMPKGCIYTEENKPEYTIYSSCCNVDKGIYYYTTYNNSTINGVDMHCEDIDGHLLISYPLRTTPQITIQNSDLLLTNL